MPKKLLPRKKQHHQHAHLLRRQHRQSCHQLGGFRVGASAQLNVGRRTSTPRFGNWRRSWVGDGSMKAIPYGLQQEARVVARASKNAEVWS
jgi:hypothetical protein